MTVFGVQGVGFNDPSELVATVVIITGPGEGIFLYNGSPGLGNQPVISLVGPATTEDPSGNPVTPDGLAVYNSAGAQAIFVGLMSGNIPVIQVGTSGNSLVTLNPQVGTPFNITTSIAGILQSALELITTDSNEVIAGLLGSVLLGTGTATKMATVLTSPLNSGNGAALVLQSENDAGTDTAICTLGLVTTPDDSTEIFTPILALYPYALIVYSGASGQVTVTKTSGSGTIPIPAGVAVGKGESWGGGFNGSSSSQIAGGPGGGSGEYAQEPSLALTGGGTASYSVGTAGNNSTLTGSAVTVTAHGATSQTGASGSTNTVHTNGNSGANGTSTNGGNGGSAPNGGTGGHGGATGAIGGAGSAPGAGGGGGGKGTVLGGNGAVGQIRLTYSTGAPTILCSIAATAGTDQFGTNYPTGTQISLADDHTSYVFGENVMHNTAAQNITSTVNAGITGLSQSVAAGGTYEFSGIFRVKQGAANVAQMLGFTGPAVSFCVWYFWGANAGAAAMGSPDVVGSLAPQSISFSAANIESYQFFEGTVTFSAGGIFQGAAAEGTAGDTFTIQPGCIMKVRRVS